MAERRWKIGVFVQARMTSARLPGKVLREARGKPMLEYLLERLDHCATARPVIVLTSTDPSDDPIAEFCRQRGRECFRGDLHDVAGRFGEALTAYELDAFVRLSGDSPLLDPALVDRAVRLFESGSYDVVTNVMPRTFPPGQSVEVVSAEAFARAQPWMAEPEHREHVTTCFYGHRQEFNICNFTSLEMLNRARLSVDTTADWEAFCRIVARFERPQWQYGLADVLKLYQQEVAEPAW